MPRSSPRLSAAASSSSVASASTASTPGRRSSRLKAEAQQQQQQQQQQTSVKAPVLSSAYLQRHVSKNDLVRRLRNVVNALGDEDVEPNSALYPGLDGLAAALVEERLLSHRDKEVRLYTVLACMEIFSVYAPEAPWDEGEVLRVFAQTIRQLANLAHCTSQAQTNFLNYFRLLEQLSVVRIGVVLVELFRTLDSESSPESKGDGEASSEDALEMLSDLVRTILMSAHIDHPAEVTQHAVTAVSACVEEFDGTVPISVLDEILMCIGAGPVVYVTNPVAVEAAAAIAAAKKKGKKDQAERLKKKMPPQQIQQTNQSFIIASKIIQRTEDRISTPIASLLNGLLNGDANIIAQTQISSSEAAPPPGSIVAQEKGSVATMAANAQPTTDVWTIIYELHRISPQILTTVIGTVTASLQSPNTQMRHRVTKLLGRLFFSPTSNIAVQFHPCYREWIRRSTDIDQKIRLTMVKYLVCMLSNKSGEKELCREATDALIRMIKQDPSVDVRVKGVHDVCDLAHSQESGDPSLLGGRTDGSSAIISAGLLLAVGNRVSSKNKSERRDAVTGLAQIYHKHYVMHELKQVQSGGDDCDIRIILDTLCKVCQLDDAVSSKHSKRKRSFVDPDDDSDGSDSYDIDEKYKWISRTVFEAACFTDTTDPDMRNRIIMIVDDVLLGSNRATQDSSGAGKKQPLTPTSRAVGLAMIVHYLQGEDERDTKSSITKAGNSNAFKWMCALLAQRASLQHALHAYIDARSKLRDCKPGSERYLTADAEAMELLEHVASLTAPVPSSSSNTSTPDGGLSEILKKLHTAKDKHIFRILATISTPIHSPSARARAFEELPKRTKSLGNVTSTWVKSLARRCAMGNFVNVETVEHCILLAQECFHEMDCKAAMVFLSCIRVVTKIYPMLGGTIDGFGNLVELFGECRSGHSSKFKKEVDESGIVTTLSGILAAVAPARATCAKPMKSLPSSQASMNDEDEDDDGNVAPLDPDLQDQLLRLCTRDGTPEQARHAVYTLAALIHPNPHNSAKIITTTASDEAAVRREREAFDPLLKALASPSRLSLASGSGTKDEGIVSILTALGALAECAPFTFSVSGDSGGTGRGERAIRFSLETVLLGRGDDEVHSSAEEESDDEKENADEEAPASKQGLSQGRRKIGGKDRREVDFGHDETHLSLPCRRACAAIELLVSHIRSTIAMVNVSKVADKQNNQKQKNGVTGISLNPPPPEHIARIFTVLVQILQDSGLPPSSRDRKHCDSSSDRAALRCCAAVHLLRLCDMSLQLEGTYLKPDMWHVLSSAFLDEERFVRESVMEELSMMFTGQGKYRHGGVASGSFAPSLRFVALIVLCADAEHGHGHSAANGNAAHVGRRSTSTKHAALQCVSQLRRTCESTLTQCRALGREAEKNFENRLKMMLMPEFAVPYALHLLAFRRETPSAGGTEAGLTSSEMSQSSDKSEGNEDEEEIIIASEEARQRMLRKRLKWLYEPLVQSLGEGADNISFLLRMTELLGSKYHPNDISRDNVSSSSIDPVASPRVESDPEKAVVQREQESAAKLKIICAASREVLLSFVKKDINLTTYPGAIQIPSALFVRSAHIPSKSKASKKGTAKKTQNGRKLENDESSSLKESLSIRSKSIQSTPKRKSTEESLKTKPISSLSPALEDDFDGNADFMDDVENNFEMEEEPHQTKPSSPGMSPIARSDSPMSVKHTPQEPTDEGEDNATPGPRRTTTPDSILRRSNRRSSARTPPTAGTSIQSQSSTKRLKLSGETSKEKEVSLKAGTPTSAVPGSILRRSRRNRIDDGKTPQSSSKESTPLFHEGHTDGEDNNISPEQMPETGKQRDSLASKSRVSFSTPEIKDIDTSLLFQETEKTSASDSPKQGSKKKKKRASPIPVLIKIGRPTSASKESENSGGRGKIKPAPQSKDIRRDAKSKRNARKSDSEFEFDDDDPNIVEAADHFLSPQRKGQRPSKKSGSNGKGDTSLSKSFSASKKRSKRSPKESEDAEAMFDQNTKASQPSARNARPSEKKKNTEPKSVGKKRSPAPAKKSKKPVKQVLKSRRSRSSPRLSASSMSAASFSSASASSRRK